MENEIERVRGGSRRSESDPAKSSHPFKGSNHCLTSFDVVLARFRVLMYMIKYAAVIGLEARTFVKFLNHFPISRFMEIVQANHRRALLSCTSNDEILQTPGRNEADILLFEDLRVPMQREAYSHPPTIAIRRSLGRCEGISVRHRAEELRTSPSVGQSQTRAL